MKPAMLRLLVPAVLLAAWLGYLGWLVANRPLQAEGYPLVVSRPQIMVSQADIIAELPARSEKGPVKVKVVEVLHDSTNTIKEGQMLDVVHLEECHPVERDKAGTPPVDWTGAGTYLLPLQVNLKGEWEPCRIPPSPGFQHYDVRRIYKATEETRAQYGTIKKP